MRAVLREILVVVDESSVQSEAAQPRRRHCRVEEDAETLYDVVEVRLADVVSRLSVAAVTVDCGTCYPASQRC